MCQVLGHAAADHTAIDDDYTGPLGQGVIHLGGVRGRGMVSLNLGRKLPGEPRQQLPTDRDRFAAQNPALPLAEQATHKYRYVRVFFVYPLTRSW